jgi:putative DNA-invertase from lambdoid prophage Rac
MSRIAYFLVSAGEQSVQSQRQGLGGAFDIEFVDEGVSSFTRAADRPGFGALLSYVRQGDIIHVSAIDRLGRDALDAQAIVCRLVERGVMIDVLGLGPIAAGVGELIVAVLAQVAEMERARIRERCDEGRDLARASLAATGRTHRGKVSLGRPVAADAKAVRSWRAENGASIKDTARQFNLSEATVKRYCAAYAG